MTSESYVTRHSCVVLIITLLNAKDFLVIPSINIIADYLFYYNVYCVNVFPYRKIILFVQTNNMPFNS